MINLMNLMRIECIFVLIAASLFLLTCYEPVDPIAPKGMEMNVYLVSSLDNSEIAFSPETIDTLKIVDIGRQYRLKILMAGLSQFDSIAIVIKTEVDSFKEILPYRFSWTDILWTEPDTVTDTMRRTITVIGYANGLLPIKKQCAIQMKILFSTPSIDTTFNEDVACLIGLKAVGPSEDSLDFFIPGLFEYRKMFSSSSLNLIRNGKDTATLNFLPLGYPGTYTIPIVVTNSQKIRSDTFFFRADVEYVDLEPVIDSIKGDTVVVEGEPLLLEIHFSNIDGDTGLSLHCDDKPQNALLLQFVDGHRGKATLTLNTAIGDTGTDTISFTVTDNGVLTKEVKFSYTVRKNSILNSIVIASGKGGYVDALYHNVKHTISEITSSDTIELSFPDSAICNIFPNTGYHIADVIVDGLSKGRIPTYCFKDVRASHEIRAEFELDQYSFFLVSDGHGTVTPPITTKIDHGTVLEIAAVADDGYHFVRWSTSGKVITADSLSVRTTVTVMDDSAKITALFKADSVAITVQPVSRSVFEGDSVAFLVMATGLDLKYQWIKGDTSVNGAVASKFSTIALLPDDKASVRCIVYNTVNCDTSTGAVLSVKRHSVHPTGISIISGSAQMFAGDSATLVVSGGALYGDSTSWVWYSAACGGSFVGKGDTITVTPLATTTYYVRAEGPGDTTRCAVITIMKKHSIHPTGISIISGSAQMCAGDSATLVVSGGVLYGDSTSWVWYSAACEGSFVGKGDTITVTPQATTTYYVRAEGPGDTTRCAAIAISVNTNSIPPSVMFANPSTVCPGVPSVLSFAGGILGTGAQWKWYKGSCGDNSAVAGTGASIVVTPNVTTTYYLRAEGQCATTICIPNTVKNYTFVQAKLIETDLTIIGDTAKLRLVSPSPAVPANDWKWFENNYKSSYVDSTPSINKFPRSPTVYYAHDMGNGKCDTTFIDTVYVDSINPFASYPFFATTDYLLRNESTLKSRYQLDLTGTAICSSSAMTPNGIDTVAIFRGDHYLQTPEFPFFPGNEFTVSFWFRTESMKGQYLFWVSNSGARLDSLKGDTLRVTSIFNGDASKNTDALKIKCQQWYFFVYKLVAVTSTKFKIETWVCDTTSIRTKDVLESTRLFNRNSNMIFGAKSSSDTCKYIGKLDKIKIFGYPITENKIDIERFKYRDGID
ncbi:MAG: hypothetical protein JW915_14105 [Chitinispirillaceae bacterium]|nr:hypothetical protein [Chitinispirillaceae bacterium]